MWFRRRTRGSPGFIQPCLPSPVERPPSGDGWLHEVKHDGFRIMARRDSAGVRLITRHGNDFTARFPLAVEAVSALSARARASTNCAGLTRLFRPPFLLNAHVVA